MAKNRRGETKVDFQDIVYRAKGLEPGGVRESEVELARSVLRSGDGNVDGALIVVSEWGKRSDAPLLATHLHHESSYTRCEAMTALCRRLGLLDEYWPHVWSFIDRRDEESDDERLTAIFLCEDFLRKNPKSNLVGCRVVKLFLDESEGDTERSSALGAILAALDPSDSRASHGISGKRSWPANVDEIIARAKKQFGCKDAA